MKRLLFVVLLAVTSHNAARSSPNLTQYGASVWCGARQNGASIERANKQMRSAMSASMVMGSGSFAGQIVGLLNSKNAMQSSLNFHIQQMCPTMLYGTNSDAPTHQRLPNATKQDIKVFNSDYCAKNPWERKCNAGNPVMNTGRETYKACSNALQKYDCKYTKYLEANPHMQDWVNSNPEMARKEALRLKAVDANEIGNVKADKPVVSAAERAAKSLTPGPKKTDCLKASDYKGCMEYHNLN